jgi:hypothetical protein
MDSRGAQGELVPVSEKTMDSHLPRKRASRSASAAAAASRSGSVSTTATKAEPVPKPEAPIIDTHLVQRVLDENARLILDWIDLRKRVAGARVAARVRCVRLSCHLVLPMRSSAHLRMLARIFSNAAAAFSDVEQTTELRRVQLQLTENIDFLANLANQQGRRGGKLKVTLPPRFLRSASAALAEAEGAAVAVADAAVAAEAMAPPARWTAYIRAASSVALNDAGTIRRLLESAIEELREHSAGDAQQGALIAQLERALSSAVFDDAAAGGAQKMANAVARDWQSASFPGVYTQFELPPPAARLRRRAPPFTTMMQGEFLFLFTVTFHANHAHNLSPSLP